MTWRTPKAIVSIVIALACVAVLGSMAYPRTVSNPALGADWQCRKALFMTTCSRISRVEPVLHNRYRDDVNDIRRV